MKAATKFVLNSYTAKIKCPYCEHENSDWLSDPRGTDSECDECGEDFQIPSNIEIEIN